MYSCTQMMSLDLSHQFRTNVFIITSQILVLKSILEFIKVDL